MAVKTALLLSLALSLAVAATAACARVRIDARAHLAEGRSLEEHGRAARDPLELRAAGEAYVRAIASFSPFDPTPARAAVALAGLVPELEPARAAALLDAAISTIDSLAVLFVPLWPEREELAEIRAGIAVTARPDGAGLASDPGAPEVSGE